jgi:hypothetical protein
MNVTPHTPEFVNPTPITTDDHDAPTTPAGFDWNRFDDALDQHYAGDIWDYCTAKREVGA